MNDICHSNNSQAVKSLLGCSVLKVLDHLPNYASSISFLPANLKERLLHLMCKRGLVTDANLPHILSPRVRDLDLSESECSDTGLVAIATQCQGLRKLDLNSAKINRTSITDSGVCQVARQCRYLQVVYLRRCLNITDQSVVELSQGCLALQELNIGGCTQVTDASLQSLGQHCSRLRSLNISRSSVTDEGIYSLVSGKCSASLKELHLSGCVELSDEAVEAVVQFCPNISILLFHSCPKLTERSRVALEEVLGNNSKVKQVTWTVY